MGILSKFTKNVNKSIESDINSITSQLERKMENSVGDLFSGALTASGISTISTRDLTSRFSDALASDRIDSYFNDASSAINRLNKNELLNNFSAKKAETSYDAAQKAQAAETKDLTLRFPEVESQYYTLLKFRKYQRTTPQSRPDNPIKQNVILPLPKDINESFNIRMSGDVDQGLAGGIANILQDKANSDVTDRALSLEVSRLAGLIDSGAQLGSIKTPSAGGAGGQLLGAIPNPFVTLLFQGVGLRTFAFEWFFSPRNIKESIQLKMIINYLKSASLPAFADNGGDAFLEYPLLVEVDFMPWADSVDDNVSKLIAFKPCMIENLNINYSPNGIPSFFSNPDNVPGGPFPTFVHLTINLHETEYFVSQDFGRGGDVTTINKLKTGVEDVSRAAVDGMFGEGTSKGITDSINELVR